MHYVRSVSATWHVLAERRTDGKAVTACDRIIKVSRQSNEAEAVRWIKPASNVCTECNWPDDVKAYWNLPLDERQPVRSGDLVMLRSAELIAEGVDRAVARRAAYYGQGTTRKRQTGEAMRMALESDW